MNITDVNIPVIFKTSAVPAFPKPNKARVNFSCFPEGFNTLRKSRYLKSCSGGLILFQSLCSCQVGDS